MTELVVACFDTQYEASVAAEKLMSHGLQPEQMVLAIERSGDGPVVASPAVTLDLPAHIDPSLMGHSTLVVELNGEMSMDDAFALLESAGASDVDAADESG